MKKQDKNIGNFPNRLPKLRFMGFEGEWNFKYGNEIFDNISNKKHNSDLPILAITQDYGAIPRDLIDFKITVTDKSVENYKVVEVGDFIISLRSFQGGIEFSEYKGICSPAYIILRPIISIDRIFFKYYLKTPKYITHLNRKLEGIRDGKMISYSYFSDIILPLPSIEEQNKVSGFLALIESRIETQKKIIEQLETLMKANRENIFSQKLRFKDEHGSDFPAWERKKIKEILTIGSGKDYKHLNYGAIPVYGTGGVITFVDSFLYDGETVCIGRKGTIDKPLYFNGKIWTVDTLFYTHSFNNSVPKFVFNIFQNINWKEYNEASGVPSLSKNTIEKIVISIPCVEEQTKIAKFLSSVQEKIETEKQILEKLELQKKFLLANLFV